VLIPINLTLGQPLTSAFTVMQRLCLEAQTTKINSVGAINAKHCASTGCGKPRGNASVRIYRRVRVRVETKCRLNGFQANRYAPALCLFNHPLQHVIR